MHDIQMIHFGFCIYKPGKEKRMQKVKEKAN